jgi:hypothetical protein
MTSFLLSKLETLMAQEEKNKQEQKNILEEIELEMEIKKRLEMNGTITKLRTQVDEFAKNIEGEIMPNNIAIVESSIEKTFQKECSDLNILHGKISDEEYKKRLTILQTKHYDIRQQINRSNNRRLSEDEKYITLKEFIDNLNKVDDKTKEFFRIASNNGRYRKNMVEIKPEIKIYHDIIPIFTTMIGLMKKQQNQIDELKKTKL